MARFSQQMLAGLLNPTYQKELTSAARGLGGAPGRMMTRQATQRSQAEIQELLQQHANNPAKLQQLANEYRARGNTDAATAFNNAATQAAAKRTAQVGALEQGASDIQKEAQRKRAIQVATQKNDQNALVALQAQALDPVTYLSGLATKKAPKPEYVYSEETVVIDGKPTRIQVGVNKADPADRQITTIGEAPPSGEGAAKRTLTEQLTGAGVTGVDLTTIEGAKKAQRDIITITGNASLANSVGQIIEDLTPLPTKEAFDLIRSARPEFSTAESLREQTSRFAALSELSDQDVAGLSALVERTLTATTENDIKAVAELQRFRKAKDLPQRIKDFSLELTSGRLSEETMSEYSLIIEAFDALASKRMADAIDNVITYGTPKEVEAAERVRNMTFGPSDARIIE